MPCKGATKIYAYLINKDLVINQKHFDSKYTPPPETTNYIAGDLLGLLRDVLGDFTRWEKDLVTKF